MICTSLQICKTNKNWSNNAIWMSRCNWKGVHFSQQPMATSKDLHRKTIIIILINQCKIILLNLLLIFNKIIKLIIKFVIIIEFFVISSLMRDKRSIILNKLINKSLFSLRNYYELFNLFFNLKSLKNLI